VYIRFWTLRLGVPWRPTRGARGPKYLRIAGHKEVGTADEWRLKTMTTEIINLTGTIGHWLNLLVARQIAAQAAKLPH
jgi:hypothetical protein